MPDSSAAPEFTALLFGLSGCLVDFGARTLPVALQHSDQAEASLSALLASADEYAEPIAGVSQLLGELQPRGLPCAWLDELPAEVNQRLAAPLPTWLQAASNPGRLWPAPDACWNALSQLQVERLDGCVLIASEPRLLQAGLNAGLWCIGLATCGPLCGLALGDWQALSEAEREKRRGDATLQPITWAYIR